MIQNNILINTETRKIKKQDYDFIGVAGENKIEQLVFKLTAFMEGIAVLEYQKDDGKTDFITLPNPENEAYILDVKNELLKDTRKIYMQLHITTANVEVFKSKIFPMNVLEQIGATTEAPEEYEEWIDVANAKIQEMSALEQSIEDAERDRSKAEQGREDEEQKRISAETTRAENETSRNSAEESRASAEQTRRTNESNRIVNENGRIEAENKRKNAETSRNSTETQRQSNETARQTAENARQDYITALRQSIENGDFDGATFIPHLDENGDLSWSNNKELDNPPTINIMGPQGPQGETGPKPVAGTDYYTQEEKEIFAAQVIAESKTEIDDFTSDKKDEITDLATDKLKELSAVNTLKIISEEVIDL